MTQFLSTWFLGGALNSAAVLMTASLGAFLSFQMRLFNFGGQGQIYAGGALSSFIILFFQNINFPAQLSFFIIIIAMLLGALAGCFMGGASGFLKQKLGANELLTTFLLSASVIPLVDFIIIDILRDKSGSLLASEKFNSYFTFQKILPPSNLSTTFFYSVLFIILFFIYLTKTKSGYRFRITGEDAEFAFAGGIKKSSYIIGVLALSGALHGIAGAFYCIGGAGRLYFGFQGGIGWNAVAMALFAKKNPLLLIPFSIIFCLILSVSENLRLLWNIKLEIKSLLEASIIFTAAVLNAKDYREKNV